MSGKFGVNSEFKLGCKLSENNKENHIGWF